MPAAAMTLDDDIAITLPGSRVTMVFCRIPAGSFRMGQRGGKYTNEEPVTRATITQGFYLGAYPVTQEQFGLWTQSPDYRAWFAATRERTRLWGHGHAVDRHSNHFRDRPQHPTDSVTWLEACGYAEWLKHTDVLPSGWVATLPSEAQWEYACRAGSSSEYWSGDGAAALTDVGWSLENSGGTTRPVGEKGRANAFGLHDMHGNIWEWCLDTWDKGSHRTRIDACTSLHSEASARVIRGGCWSVPAANCRSAARAWNGLGNRFRGLGFRLACTPGVTGSAGSDTVGAAERAGLR